MNKKTIEGVIGWYGAIAILAAYALLSLEILNFNNFLYQFLNISGALGLIFHSFRKKDYPPGILNVVWAIIAIVALIQK